jgi:SAM-dependent methyltransferase
VLCRHCRHPLTQRFLDLGFAPASNAYLSASDLNRPERYYPLRIFVCDACWLVQTEDHANARELFGDDYAYFSSVSESWLEHARHYARAVTEEFSLDRDSLVLEIGCNDGYLLRNFVAAGIPCLGVEPAASTAEHAKRQGIPVLQAFFGSELGRSLAASGSGADLIVANNVYAHVPDINDFTAGLKAALKPGGTITLEFPHLMQLIAGAQFDTVYHEHYSYLSLQAVERIFEAAGLRVWRVDALPTHGGSLRVFGCNADDPRGRERSVDMTLAAERAAGLTQLATYRAFQRKADAIKNGLLRFLLESHADGLKVAAYGAAAKGNTLLNYAGVKPDLLPFVCDAAPSKQGKFLPGSHIPIVAPDALERERPAVVLILPWNIADEVVARQRHVHAWGARFAVALPELRYLDPVL